MNILIGNNLLYVMFSSIDTVTSSKISLKFHVSQYINTINKGSGQCVNTSEFGDEPIYWDGFIFTVRDDLDDYDCVEEWKWRSALNNITQYSYRVIKDDPRCSNDVVRSEFSLWYGDWCGSEFSNVMIKLENVIYIDDIKNKIKKETPLSKLEQIALYINDNQHSIIKTKSKKEKVVKVKKSEKEVKK